MDFVKTGTHFDLLNIMSKNESPQIQEIEIDHIEKKKMSLEHVLIVRENGYAIISKFYYLPMLPVTSEGNETPFTFSTVMEINQQSGDWGIQKLFNSIVSKKNENGTIFETRGPRI